ncbi:MAG: NapC/NirT family cytochrome c [Planctomycetota bacterium]
MKLPRIVHNRLCYVGATIALLAFAVFLFLFIISTVTGAGEAPYAGLVIFIFVPAIMLFGLALIPPGMFLEWQRLRRHKPEIVPRFPLIDLNNPRHRNAMFIFIVGSVVLLVLSAFGGYQAYHYTDSVGFCGTICHDVMKPEYTAYQNSPHARVTCAECHVGPGADWFVRSKLSGAYQVYAVLFNKFPRPIATPIQSLRPAQETCEQCHWPQQFFGGQERKFIHYLSSEDNPRWDIQMLVKIGGGNPAAGQTEGIHWHMNIANRVEYVATDEKRHTIPWLRLTNRTTGEVTEYLSKGVQVSPEEIANARVMDCMDCHNRPTHIYRSPSYAVNLALARGQIDPELPSAKATAVEILSDSYASTEEALAAIEKRWREFYEREHPDLAADGGPAISKAAEVLHDIYRNNIFPEMKVRWDSYPDNIGHLEAPGCFRCHDGNHVSSDGKVLSKDCRICHTILAQGKPGELEFASGPEGLDFRHPEDIGDMWQEGICTDCHTGGPP